MIASAGYSLGFASREDLHDRAGVGGVYVEVVVSRASCADTSPRLIQAAVAVDMELSSWPVASLKRAR